MLGWPWRACLCGAALCACPLSEPIAWFKVIRSRIYLQDASSMPPAGPTCMAWAPQAQTLHELLLPRCLPSGLGKHVARVQSAVSGPGLGTMLAGLPGTVAVQPADAWGNSRGGLGDRLWLQYTPSGGSAVRLPMAANSSGISVASYSVSAAGTGAVAVAVLYDAPQVSHCWCFCAACKHVAERLL